MLEIKKNILQQFSLSITGIDSIHQGDLKSQWYVSLFCLENIMWTSQLRKKLPCSRNKTAATRPAFPFLAYQETYSQQLYIQFIIHNKGSTGLTMPWEKSIKISKLMEIIIITKPTGLYSFINLYCHKWISVILGILRNRGIALELRVVLDDKLNEPAMYSSRKNVQLYPEVHWAQYSHLVWKRRLSHYIQYWCSLTSTTTCNFGLDSVRRI